MEIITAVIYRPGQRGEIIKIEPTLEKLQELVGGASNPHRSRKPRRKPAHGYC